MIGDEQSAKAWLRTLPEYDAIAEQRLEQFAAFLFEENIRQNLVAASSLDHLWQRHIADSAQLLLHVPRETAATWLDLGTGAGFPGLVLAILRPEVDISLVESRPLRAQWLQEACSDLRIANARVICSRLKSIESRIFSVISARAFAPLARLLKLSARFSDANTRWLLPKGRSAAHELQELTSWRHMFHVEQSLTDSEAGLIVGQLCGKAERSRADDSDSNCQSKRWCGKDHHRDQSGHRAGSDRLAYVADRP